MKIPGTSQRLKLRWYCPPETVYSNRQQSGRKCQIAPAEMQCAEFYVCWGVLNQTENRWAAYRGNLNAEVDEWRTVVDNKLLKSNENGRIYSCLRLIGKEWEMEFTNRADLMRFVHGSTIAGMKIYHFIMVVMKLDSGWIEKQPEQYKRQNIFKADFQLRNNGFPNL